jgi:hypothetical protein
VVAHMGVLMARQGSLKRAAIVASGLGLVGSGRERCAPGVGDDEEDW